MHTTSAFILLAMPFLTLAADGIPESLFTNENGVSAAILGKPLFYFASGSCYPQSAVDANGNMVPSTDQDYCAVEQMDLGCETKIPWLGHNNVPSNPGPIYWSVDKCGDNTYRVVYNLFFTHDSGHPYDWEWAAVIWSQGGNGLWYPSHMLLEQDGHHADYPWSAVDTFNDMNDVFNNGYGANKNHPKVYVSKFHHSMHLDNCDSDKNSCAYLADYEFRATDYYMYNILSTDMHHISVINAGWDFGDARNPHDTSKYICSDPLDGGGKFCSAPPPNPPLHPPPPSSPRDGADEGDAASKGKGAHGEAKLVVQEGLDL